MSPEKQNENDIEDTSSRWEKSQQKFSEVGHLGVTAQDHWDIGSSPPLLLNRNPGRTLGELYSDEELLKYLDNLINYKEEAEKRIEADPNDRWAQGNLEDFNERFPVTIKYLSSIGRLPDKYKDYQ